MNTCDTCRFWKVYQTSNGRSMAGECQCVKLATGTHPAEDGMACAPEVGQFVSPYTGPRFGCIHHSPIEPVTIPETFSIADCLRETGHPAAKLLRPKP